MRSVVLMAGLAATIAVTMPNAVDAQSYRLSASPKEKLRHIFRPHTYNRLPITRAMRAATGNPNISVIDRRRDGRVSLCSYAYQNGRRVIVCN